MTHANRPELSPDLITVKRYGGTRLYDGAQGGYVSLGQLQDWVQAGIAVRIIDAESGDDISAVLLS